MLQLKTKLLLLAIVFTAKALFAQSVDIDRLSKSPIITPSVAFLKTDTILLLEAVLKEEYQKKFTFFHSKPLFFTGFNPYFYWFRFSVENKGAEAQQLFLDIGPVGYREAVLYQAAGRNKWKVAGKVGNKYSFGERPYPSLHGIVPLTIKAHSTDSFYISMDYSHNYKTFGFALLDSRKLHQLESKVYLVFGIMTGVLLLFTVLNLYLFFSLKERIHLWYSAYILWLIYLLFKYEGLDEQFLFLDSELANRVLPLMAVGGIAISLLLHVAQLYLTNITRGHLLYKATRLVKINIVVSVVAHSLVFYLQSNYRVESFFFEYANKSTLLGVLFIGVNCVVSYYKKFKPALFILLGTAVFLVGGLEKMLFVTRPSYMFPPSLFEIGMVLEAGIISFGLMYRYNLFKQGKDALGKQLQLERIRSTELIIETQEAEQRRIAEDLHDELSGDIAAIKMKLQNPQLQPAHLKEIIGMSDGVSRKVREISHNLMPPDFAVTDFQELLQAKFHELSKSERPVFNFHLFGSGDCFTKREQLSIYRIISELIHNIKKHADATEATFQLIYYDDRLEIMAEDNGVGFNQERSDGIGLKNVSSRVAYMNGQMRVDSNRKGTTVIIQLPFKSICS
jgi:signal transduction histidine kinase